MQNYRAGVYIVLSMLCYTVNDALVKVLSSDLPIGEIIFLRGTVMCLFLLLYARHLRRPVINVLLWNRWNIIRSLLEVAATFTFLFAISLLPLSIATTLIFVAPVLITIMAAFWLRESVTMVRWFAVLSGLVGVVFVSRSDANYWGYALLLPLFAALASAFRDIVTRKLPASTDSHQVALTASFSVTIAGFLTLPLGWVQPDWQHGLLLLACAALLGTAYVLYIIATRIGELSFISPFKYVGIVFAIVITWLFWGEKPTFLMFLGATIIISSGLIMAWQSRNQKDR